MDLKLLSETYGLNAFFRCQIKYPFSQEILDYLLDLETITDEEIQKRWDNFDKIFPSKGKLISALSFSAITEAKDLLLDSILEQNKKKETLILELACGFSPRALNFINNKGYYSAYYIETDRLEIVTIKNKFYNKIKKSGKKVSNLKKLDVLQTQDWDIMLDYIVHIKQKNPNINKIIMLSHGLIYYINREDQKTFFENIRKFMLKLRDLWLEISYLKTDIPTHKNFTDWLIYEGFSHKNHIKVMNKVDPSIINSLHEDETDFLKFNSINNIRKYYYNDEIIRNLHTPNLVKYRNINNLQEKISNFLKQKILFIYEIL